MKILSICIVLALTACSTMPDTKIKQPLSAKPAAPAVAADNNGSIFQAGRSNPRMGIAMFEDRRASQVGDTLTVNLVENSSAKRTSSTTDERKVSGNISVPSPTILGKSNIVGATTWNPSSDNKLENTDNRSNVNTISGAITVTVTEVLPNGNLRVAGEKMLSINSESEYIRLAGVVNPQLVSTSNSINSTQLADVQFESKSTQSIEKSQFNTMLARFFLTILPF
jgi:flagellar L-ring protein precursor FlgH